MTGMFSTRLATFVNGSHLTARRNTWDNRVHWYRTTDLGDGLTADRYWAFPWCRAHVPYAVRDPKSELRTDLTGPVCAPCNETSAIR